MNKLISFCFCLILWLIFAGCIRSNEIERPLDSWVVRINLDQRPQMVGLALNKNLYAAYDAQLGALYKAWKGDILFTGPVYDNIHGTQPITRGEAYIQDTLATNPWLVITGGETLSIPADYQGYLRKEQKITFKYHLSIPSGEKITIKETPEYVVSSDGRPGFERVFETANLSSGTDVLLAVSFEHLTIENDVKTNGQWVEISFKEQQFDWGSSLAGKGVLKLNSNGKTKLTSFFEPKATAHIEVDAEEASEDTQEGAVTNPDIEDIEDISVLAARGIDVIGKNDCAACHTVDKPIIGPSYTMVAQKYGSTIDVVEQLAQKIINGGAGVWGERAMSPHPNVTEAEAKAMAAYILSAMPDDQVERKPGLAVDFYDIGQPLPSLPEVVAGQNPNVSVVYPQIDFHSGNPDRGMATDENFSGFVTDFVMEVNGYLNVQESKTYDLQFIANNGGRLTIDGKVVSQGHFYEGTFEEDFEIYLAEGAHPIRIDFYHHLFSKYLILGWRESKDQEYEPIPASAFTHNPFDIKPTSPGIKSIVGNKAPGFGASLEKVHPSFDLTAVRPEGFEPRVGDIEFMEDGRLVLCTWDGEVFEMENVTNGVLDDVKVTKIADGLCEPLGITVVDGDVYVLQRWELTRLIDHDGDRTTDEYARIASFGSNGQFHEWSFGLIYRDGYFYCTTGIAMGRGSDNMHIDRGKALKIGMDGTYSYVAHGLKEANGIGFGPDGEIFVTDNEGEYQPVCKIFHIPAEGNPFYGNKSVEADHLPEDIKEVLPVIWLPQNEIGNSPSQPILMHHGPYEGQMIHGEITHGGIKRDFIEKVKGQYQGAVFRFAQGLEVGINRMEWGPDGALYAAGLGGSQDFGHQGHTFGLQRLTYNGTPAFEMLAIRAKSNGLEVEFTKPLRVGDGTDPGDYKVQQWYYTWTHEGESQQKRNLENLKILSVTLSDDRGKAFLELEGMKRGHVLYVQLQPTFLSENNEQLWSNEGWYTLNEFPDEAGEVRPYPYLAKANQLSPPEIEAGWTMMFDGRTAQGWQPIGKAQGWRASVGHLLAQGGSALLATERSFNNFELELEWKLENGAEGGILFKLPESSDLEEALAISPRMQLIDDQGNPDAKAVPKHKTGANYDISPPKYVVSQPTNEYNHARLVVIDNQVEHWINGIKVTEYQIGSYQWKASLGGTIYENVADYGQAAKGQIALYSQQGKIWFRNIKIRELGPGSDQLDIR